MEWARNYSLRYGREYAANHNTPSRIDIVYAGVVVQEGRLTHKTNGQRFRVACEVAADKTVTWSVSSSMRSMRGFSSIAS
jgi:hypothetical protein